jgi:hypothetical protein
MWVGWVSVLVFSPKRNKDIVIFVCISNLGSLTILYILFFSFNKYINEIICIKIYNAYDFICIAIFHLDEKCWLYLTYV